MYHASHNSDSRLKITPPLADNISVRGKFLTIVGKRIGTGASRDQGQETTMGTYTIDIRDDCGDWGRDVSVEADTPDAALDLAEAYVEEHISEGDYGQEEEGGARVRVYLTATDEYGDEETRSVEIDIEPDHDWLIREAWLELGASDLDCDHEWTSAGEGGCDENPGVWATGGTSTLFREHCAHCGLVREKAHTFGA